MKSTSAPADFDQRYQTHLKHLKLKGRQPKNIDAYARAMRRMGDYFGYSIDNLSPAQLTGCVLIVKSSSSRPIDLHLAAIGKTVAQVQVNKALIRHACLFGHIFEVLHNVI